MKKTIKLIILVFSLLIVGLVLTNIIISRTHLSSYQNAYIKFDYLDKKVYIKLNDDEFKIVSRILDNRYLSYDNPSCGFDINCSIIFKSGESSKIICFACDGDATFEDLDTGKFFGISGKDNKTIDRVLLKYGVKFPCL